MRGGDDGSGLNERSNGRACGSEGRWSSGSISSFDNLLSFAIDLMSVALVLVLYQ